MGPRCGKKRYRARNPLPLWLPLPRPCLRSLNVPGPPYYIPISPDMYLPPWTLSPPYFTKPICHCANENFCTTRDCRNSTECLKMNPMFCPHGTDIEENSDLQQKILEQQLNNNNQETSSNSDMNICPACGAPSRKLRTLCDISKNNHINEQRSHYTPKVMGTQNSSHTLKNNQDLEDKLEKRNVCVIEKNVPSRERNHVTESDHSSPEFVLSKTLPNNCVNSSCQTTFSNSQTGGNNTFITQNKYNLNAPKRNKNSTESTTNIAEVTERSLNSHISTPAHLYKAPNNLTKNEFGCSNCSEQKKEPANKFVEKHISNAIPGMPKALEGTIEKMVTNSIHVNQLSNNVSNARRMQINKYSGCCISGLEKSCRTDTDFDTISKPLIEIPYNDVNKSGKKPECGCYSKTASKTSSRSHKLSKCICTTKTFKEPLRCRKKSKCECSPNKNPQNHTSRSHKLSECGCSSTNITQKSNSCKVSERSCPPSDSYHKTSSGYRNTSITEISSKGCDFNANSSILTSNKSNKNIKDIRNSNETNMRQSSCQCKFPPAYEHLNCTGNLTDNCNCTDNS